jgi:hypothetical protein
VCSADKTKEGKIGNIKRKEPWPYVNHYYFHIWDQDWGRHRVVRLWYRTLRQRSQRRPTWTKLGPIFDHWLPIPRVCACLSGRSLRRQTPSGVTSKVRMP